MCLEPRTFRAINTCASHHANCTRIYPCLLFCSLACRCNYRALKSGFKYFALRYYGLCYGANKISSSASDKCLGQSYLPCDDKTTEECVGIDYVDYLYEVGKTRLLLSALHGTRALHLPRFWRSALRRG